MFCFLVAFIAPWILSQNLLLNHAVSAPQPDSYQNKALTPSVLCCAVTSCFQLSPRGVSGFAPGCPSHGHCPCFSPCSATRGCVCAPVPSSPSWHTHTCPWAFWSWNDSSQPCSGAIFVLHSPSPSSAARRFCCLLRAAMGQGWGYLARRKGCSLSLELSTIPS